QFLLSGAKPALNRRLEADALTTPLRCSIAFRAQSSVSTESAASSCFRHSSRPVSCLSMSSTALFSVVSDMVIARPSPIWGAPLAPHTHHTPPASHKGAFVRLYPYTRRITSRRG